MRILSEFSELKLEDVNEAAQIFLKFAKNFDCQYGNLKNIKIVYGEVLKTFKFFCCVSKQQGPTC
jgi:hypothetical protein